MSTFSTFRNSLTQTGQVIRFASTRNDAMLVVGITGILYIVVYLYAIGDLSYQPGVGHQLIFVDHPLHRMFEPGPGRFSYEAVALIDVWTIRYLFSPLNLLLGFLLSVLVGINLGLSYLAVIQPKACGIGTGSGILASIPALLAGSACCAPVILVVFGITASGTLLSLISWLVPIGFMLLIVSLIYMARQINPVASSS